MKIRIASLLANREAIALAGLAGARTSNGTGTSANAAKGDASVNRHEKASFGGSTLDSGLRLFGAAAAVTALFFVALVPPAFGVDRAYEQVTPVEKYDDPNVESHRASLAAPDGNRVAFGSFVPLPVANMGSAFAAHSSPYMSFRTSDRWETAPAGPRMTRGGVAVVSLFASGGSGLVRSIVGTTSGWQGEPGSDSGVYLRDYPSGTNTLLWPIDQDGGNFADDSGDQVASTDLSHVAFVSGKVRTTDPGIPASEEIKKIYEWVNGQLRLVSLDTANEPFGESAQIGGSSSKQNALSQDARHIFFTTPTVGEAKKIYRRSDGATTTLVSPSQSTVADPLGEKAKNYVAASTDGDMVFFTSSEQLTDDANTGPERKGSDLYRYEVSTDTLIDVSAGAADADGAQVQGVLGASDDGSSIYYVAKGQVLPGEGTAGEPNLYLWHDDGSASGETRFVATLASSPCSQELDGDGCSYAAQIDQRTSRVSNDGSTAIFSSAASLTGYPNNGHTQIYVYDASAQGGAGQLSCVSCNPNGGPATGDAIVSGTSFITGRQFGNERQSRVLSADGSRVYFNSPEALLPQEDTNGVVDVYEWEAGSLDLISTGRSPYASYFTGASASGNDVFFYTRDQLVGQDGDTYYDIYDARVGGGLASQFPIPPGVPCVADACKPGPTAQPLSPPEWSSSFSGPGNLKSAPGKCSAAAKRARKSTRNAKRLRRQAKRIGKSAKGERTRRKAIRASKQARKQRTRAKRCRKKAKRTNSSRVRRMSHNGEATR